MVDPLDEAKKDKQPFYKLDSAKDPKLFHMVHEHQLSDLMRIKTDFERDVESNMKVESFLKKRGGMDELDAKVLN